VNSLFISELWRNPQFFLVAFFFVVFSVSCHEFMHAWVALKQGDPTAADRGHLTLNPLRQMSLWSLILFAFVGIAGGAVPVNPANFRHRHSRALVALAGPSANLMLGIIFALVFALVPLPEVTRNNLVYGAALNFALLLLNLLPVPGLDGWSVLADFFPKIERCDSEWIKGAFFVLIALVFFFMEYLWIAAGLMFSCVVGLITLIAG